MHFFYIIQRSGVITEVPYSEDNYNGAFNEWVRGGRLVVKPNGHKMPMGINAVDVSNILDAESYEAYIRTAKPKTYIRSGIWYDGKEHREVAVEKWLQDQRQEQKAIAAQPEEVSPEQRKKNLQWIAQIKEQLRTKFTSHK